MARKIKTKLECYTNAPEGFGLGGWFCEELTYLWFGTKEESYAALSGHKLYRLAKAIVKQFEQERGGGK